MTKLLLILTVLLLIVGCRMALKKAANTTGITGTDLEEFAGALYPVAQDGKWGYMNHRFEIVIPFQFLHAEDFSEGLAAVSNRAEGTGNNTTELYACIDSTGKLVTGYLYNRIYVFSEGLALVVKDGRYGYIDKTGAEVITPQFEDGASFSEGLAAVKKNGLNGFIDKSGRFVIEPRFTRACWVSSFRDGLAPVYFPDDSGGFINKKGELVIPASFSYVSAFSEGLALVQPKGNHQYGYINHKSEMIIKPEYDLSLPFHEGVASVKKRRADGTTFFRIIDKNGQALTGDLNYNFVGIFREGLAGVESTDHRWGFIDKKGEEIIPPRYASARLFNNGLSVVQTGHLFTQLHTSYIDKSGRMVFKGE